MSAKTIGFLGAWRKAGAMPAKVVEHLRLSDLGMEKGKTAATDEAVAKVVGMGKHRLAG